MLAAVLAVAAACPEPERAAMLPAPAARTEPEFLYTGCEVVLAGPVCTLRPQARLSLWVAAQPAARLMLELGGEPVDVAWTPAEDGLRTSLVPGERLGPLVLRDAEAPWRHTLTLAPEAGLPAVLSAIDERSQAGEHEAAARALDARLPALTGAVRAEALKLRGDIEFRRRDFAAMARAYEVAYDAALAEGLLRSASIIALTAVFVCTIDHEDRPCAHRWLDRHAELLAVLPDARINHTYYAGLLADREGDLRTAIRSFEQSARDARALGLDTELATALLMVGAVQSRLGDTRRARATATEMLALRERLSPSNRAKVLNSAAWIDLEARARGELVPDPEPRFVEALAILGSAGPDSDPVAAAEATLNLTLAALLRSDAAAARAALAALAPPNRRVQRWQLYLTGRIELAETRLDAALRHFDELAVAATTAADNPLAWAAAIGAGQALEGLGRSALALEHYRRAAALHSVRLGALAVNGGRDRFALEGDRGARLLVRLLLRLGRAEEAACAGRLARNQVFAGLAAAARDPDALATYRVARKQLEEELEATWERPTRVAEQQRAELRQRARQLDVMLDAALTGPIELNEPDCDTLRAPDPDEPVLAYYPIEGGHAGFLLDGATTVGVEIVGPLASDPAELTRQLLAPFTAAIARAERLRIIASGPASRVPFHELPWMGRPLIDHVAVSYSLDLSERPDLPAKPRRAVQLAPPSNLGKATAELDDAAMILRSHGVALERLAGDEPDLRTRLGADLLHYVGHAHGDGWASALDLGGDRRLTAGDLLAADAPNVAVLSGCETGLPDPTAPAGGMSLAHALLVAGASSVIATDAAVDDDEAADLIPAVITALAEGIGPVEALRQAQRARLDRSGWARFRVLVP